MNKIDLKKIQKQSSTLVEHTAKKRRHISTGITLANVEKLNVLQDLLSMIHIEDAIRKEQFKLNNIQQKQHHQITNTKAILDVWINKVSQDLNDQRTLKEKLQESLVQSTKPEKYTDSMKSAGLYFEILQHSLQNLYPMSQNIQQSEIITQAMYSQICSSLVGVYKWYTIWGPQIYSTLFQIHQSQGYSFLQRELPEFAQLIDHIFQFAYQQLVVKFETTNGSTKINPNRQRKATFAPIQKPEFGTIIPDNELSSVPPDLYGLHKNNKDNKNKITLFSFESSKIEHNHNSLLENCVFCLEKLLSNTIIIPGLTEMDKTLSGQKPSKFDYTSVYERTITRGAILSCLSDTCDGDGIFSSSYIIPLLRNPALIYEEKVSKASRFAIKLKKDRENTLKPLLDYIKAFINENPSFPAKAKELGKLAHRQMVAICGYSDLPKKATNSSSETAPKIISTPALQPIELNDLISEEYQQSGIHIGSLNLILREALNRERKLEAGDDALHRVLQGDHATTSSKTKFNPDQTNPLRNKLKAGELLESHMSGLQLTSKVGICNLLSWLGTGQGVQTKQFLSLLPKSFFFATKEEIVEHFEATKKKNEQIQSEYPEGTDLSKIPGLISYCDVNIWGTANQLLSVNPTVGPKEQKYQMSVDDKFAPYWSEEVQNSWVTILGEMYNKDPATYTGEKPSWLTLINYINGLGISGFGSGLTPFQLVNYLAIFGLTSLPAVSEMTAWIMSNNSELGAFRGLTDLGFNVSISNPMSIHYAFSIVYQFFNIMLTPRDKSLCSFSPIFIEHILCKIPRWKHRFQSIKAAAHFEQLVLVAENATNQWIPGENETNHMAYPLPSIISIDWIKTFMN